MPHVGVDDDALGFDCAGVTPTILEPSLKKAMPGEALKRVTGGSLNSSRDTEMPLRERAKSKRTNPLSLPHDQVQHLPPFLYIRVDDSLVCTRGTFLGRLRRRPRPKCGPSDRGGVPGLLTACSEGGIGLGHLTTRNLPVRGADILPTFPMINVPEGELPVGPRRLTGCADGRRPIGYRRRGAAET